MSDHTITINRCGHHCRLAHPDPVGEMDVTLEHVAHTLAHYDISDQDWEEVRRWFEHAASPSGPSPDRMPVHDNDMDQADDLDEALATARQRGREEADNLLELAWGVIANAGWDDLSKSPGWQEAAERWRDRYHAYLDAIARGGDRP